MAVAQAAQKGFLDDVFCGFAISHKRKTKLYRGMR